MRNALLLLVLLTIVCAAACVPSTGNTPVSTLTLIPSTATLTPTVAPPTATTSSSLVNPQDVIPPTPTTSLSASLEDLSGAALVAEDPVAAELVGIAQRTVADELDLPIRRIRLIDMRAVVWTDSALNCPLPESEAVLQETDGYRIVLGAGEQEYIFHTDVDRVVLCDPENEALPEGVLDEATPEATSEATPEVTAEATES